LPFNQDWLYISYALRDTPTKVPTDQLGSDLTIRSQRRAIMRVEFSADSQTQKPKSSAKIFRAVGNSKAWPDYC